MTGAGTGALAGGATGLVVSGGAAVLPGAGAGAVGGGIWGGVSGLLRAAVASDAKDAAIGGAKAGAVGGAIGGALRAYGAVRAIKLVPSQKELKDLNKLHHIFRLEENHTPLQQLVARYGSEQAAHKAIQQAVIDALKRKGQTARDYTEEVVVGGMKLLVRGVIINGVVRIGSAWVP